MIPLRFALDWPPNKPGIHRYRRGTAIVLFQVQKRPGGLEIAEGSSSPRKLPSRIQKTEEIGHHRIQFSRTSHLMPQRRRLAEDLFAIAPIRSEKGRAVFRDIIDFYQQDTEVAFRPGLEPEKCRCTAKAPFAHHNWYST